MVFWKRKKADKKADKKEWWQENRFLSQLPLIDLYIHHRYGNSAGRVPKDTLRRDVERFLSDLDKLKVINRKRRWQAKD